MKTIKVSLDSLIYLNKECRRQRCGDELSEKAIERITKSYNQFYKNGRDLASGDLGGAIGKPENSYEEGRWTSWSIEDMKQMLDEQNLPYQDSEQDRINIRI